MRNLKGYVNMAELMAGLVQYFAFYNVKYCANPLGTGHRPASIAMGSAVAL